MPYRFLTVAGSTPIYGVGYPPRLDPCVPRLSSGVPGIMPVISPSHCKRIVGYISAPDAAPNPHNPLYSNRSVSRYAAQHRYLGATA